jgi:hypothetical protein
MESSPHEVTQLLQAWGEGDQGAFDKLVPVVYQELRRLARHYMVQERPDHTPQSAALVNEAYLRLVDSQTEGLAESRSLFRGFSPINAAHPGRFRALAPILEARRRYSPDLSERGAMSLDRTGCGPGGPRSGPELAGRAG